MLSYGHHICAAFVKQMLMASIDELSQTPENDALSRIVVMPLTTILPMYWKSRYYDPELRRFISMDRLEILEAKQDLLELL